jgi:mannose-6-phosphate isomerase-like protein (cupin superfamily)
LPGLFVCSHHDNEDELFLVTKGTMVMQFRDRDVAVNPGEFIIVPRLVEHCPSVPHGEVECMLFEPATTLNTGNVVSDKTVTELDELTAAGDIRRGSGNDYNKTKKTAVTE